MRQFSFLDRVSLQGFLLGDGLDDENIFAAHRLFDLDPCFCGGKIIK